MGWWMERCEDKEARPVPHGQQASCIGAMRQGLSVEIGLEVASLGYVCFQGDKDGVNSVSDKGRQEQQHGGQ